MNKKVISLTDRNIKTLVNKGQTALYDGELVTAKQCFEEAYRLNPLDVNVIYNLAALHVDGNDTTYSEELLQKAFHKDPNHLYTLIGLANIVYYKTENFETASYYLEPALKQNPESPELLTAYANLCMLEGRRKQAIEYFQAALDVNHDYAPARSGIATVYNFAGLHNLSKHRFDQAIFSFNRAVSFNEEWLAPKLNIVRTFGFLKSYKKANSSLNNIKQNYFDHRVDIDYLIELQDDLSHNQLMGPLMVFLTEAKLLQQTNHPDEAEELFRKILGINHKFPTLNYSLALINLEKGDLDAAEFHIKEELVVSPNSIKVKALRYIIYSRKGCISSWDIHFNILKKASEDIYKVFDAAVLLKRFNVMNESEDLFTHARRLNPGIYKQLIERSDEDVAVNAIYVTGELSLV